MATGDTALSLALSSPPPPLLQHSPSDASSPLSDVEDKHGDPDDMDLDMNSSHSQLGETSVRTDNRDAADSDLGAETDDESKLSDVDINDSEAETERLYDTPPKDRVSRDIVNTASEPGTRQFTDRRDRTFERSPSKLQQQIKADYEPENIASGQNTPSEEADEGDEEASEDLSEEEPESAAELPPARSPVLVKKVQAVSASTETVLTLSPRHDTLKRKRSSITEQDLDQPLRKRAESNTSPEEPSADDVPVVDIEVISTNPESGNQSAEEDNNDEPVATAGADGVTKDETEPAEAIEEDATDDRTKKGKRGGAKKRKSPTPDEPGGDEAEETNADASAHTDVVAVEDSGVQAEEDQIDDVDEEAEAAHRNEEECT